LLWGRAHHESVSRETRELLLAHELAHLARRDHFLRWLEWGVRALFWWVVPVWWVGRRLREAQEASCDAVVQRLYPGGAHEYAVALLDALDFAAGAPVAPSVQSSAAPRMRRRLERLVRPGRPGFTGSAAAAVLTVVLVVVLPCTVGVRARETAGRAATPITLRWTVSVEPTREPSGDPLRSQKYVFVAAEFTYTVCPTR
jgi:beta-lactamase regulating signal transducer with metallopeptidase domain